MKIFNIEDGKKKVYVQLNDLSMLDSCLESVPASILSKFYDSTIMVSDRNRMDFIEYTSPEEISFFESQDWIVDYKELRGLKEEELLAIEQSIIEEMNEISSSYNGADASGREILEDRYKRLEYKMRYIAEIISLKKGTITMPFPVVADSDGFTLVADAGVGYTIKGSLDPNKFMLFRNDGMTLSLSDRIPRGFLQTGIGLALMEQKGGSQFCDYEMNYSMADDKSYFLIEFRTKDPSIRNEKNKSESKIKRLVKRLTGKNKK